MAFDDSQLPLGKATVYAEHYDPSLLVPVLRKATRDFWPATEALPFTGSDLWTAYEVSWLNPRGKPQVACLLIEYDAGSPAIVESKSLKLYLNAFNQTRLDNAAALLDLVCRDLSSVAGCPVIATLHDAGSSGIMQNIQPWHDTCIDHRDIVIRNYDVDPLLLSAHEAAGQQQTCVSHLLRSLCPVTGQPDWASVRISAEGILICEDSLLRYLCSYRRHQGFHEQCIERIFCDIWRQCRPQRLSVEGRFTRRGGIDINPFRSSDPAMQPTRQRQVRQ